MWPFIVTKRAAPLLAPRGLRCQKISNERCRGGLPPPGRNLLHKPAAFEPMNLDGQGDSGRSIPTNWMVRFTPMCVMLCNNERHPMPAFARATSSLVFHFGSIVGGLALLLGGAVSGCSAGAGDGSGTAGASGAAGSTAGTSGAGRGGTTGSAGTTGQAGTGQAGTSGSAGTTGTAGVGAAGTGGSAGTTGAAGAGVAGTMGSAGSGPGTGGRGGSAGAGRGGMGGDGGSAGGPGTAGRGGAGGRGGAAGTGTAGTGTGGAGGSGARGAQRRLRQGADAEEQPDDRDQLQHGHDRRHESPVHHPLPE